MMKIKIRGMAFDADKWITVKPNGADKKGRPVKIGENGEVKAGMGGKFNGQKISEIRKDFTGAKTPDKKTLEANKKSQSTPKRDLSSLPSRLSPDDLSAINNQKEWLKSEIKKNKKLFKSQGLPNDVVNDRVRNQTKQLGRIESLAQLYSVRAELLKMKPNDKATQDKMNEILGEIDAIKKSKANDNPDKATQGSSNQNDISQTHKDFLEKAKATQAEREANQKQVEADKNNDKPVSKKRADFDRARKVSRDLGMDLVKNSMRTDGIDLSHVDKATINSLSKSVEKAILSPEVFSDLKFASYRDGATFDAREYFNSKDLERLEKANLVREVDGWKYEFTKEGKYLANQMIEYGSKRFRDKNYAADSDSIALDESVRHKDKNGHLIVKETVITKEDVNPYYGRDIPNFEELGLDPDKIYYLYRPLEEIEKAAESFKGKQLLLKHKKVDSQNPEKGITIGAIGSDLKVKDGKLYGDMTFWDDEAIALIESRKHEQLSAGYGYDVQMTPGEFGGVEYDGVMTNLSGNHVALVKRGRIGNDAIICDEKTVGNTNMKFKKGSMPKIAAAIKMAFDSDFEEDSIVEVANAVDEAREDGAIANKNSLEESLSKHFDEDVVARIMEVLGGADANNEQTQAERDNESEAMRIKEREEREARDRERDREEANDSVDPEELKREIMEKVQALFQAKDEVKELVGEVAMDSAEDVYKFALEQKGVSTKGVHPSAYQSMFAMLKGQSKAKPIAMDSAYTNRDNAKKLAPHIKL